MLYITKIIQDNFFSKLIYLPKILDSTIVRYHDTCLTVESEINSPTFNIAYLLPNYIYSLSQVNEDIYKKYIIAVIEEIIPFFNGKSFSWWISPADPNNITLANILRKLAFKADSYNYAMAIDSCEQKIDTDIKHQVNFQTTLSFPSNYKEEDSSDKQKILVQPVMKVVTSRSDFRFFAQVMSFFDNQAINLYDKIAKLEWSKKEELRLFVAYLNDSPVAVSSLFFSQDNEVAGISDLITIPIMRNQGIGSFVIKHLINYASEKGAKFITATASSEEGMRIFRKLGFKVYGKFWCYNWDR